MRRNWPFVALLLAVLAMSVRATPAAAESSADPLVEQIDATVDEIDGVLNGYLEDYLESVGLKSSELRSIERRLERQAREDRPKDQTSYRGVPASFFLVQAKMRFLAAAHPAFSEGGMPDNVARLLERLGNLERQLAREATAE